MARYTHWKEAKVALNILFCFVFISVSAQSQSLKSNVTYSCRAERLESVIDHLSKSTGYDFIYSRDLVDVSKPVTLSVKNKSIGETLALIEKQVNVLFKIKERHIIVKNIPKPVDVAKVIAKTAGDQPFDSLLISSSSTESALRFEDHLGLLQSQLDKRMREIQSMIGSAAPREIPISYIRCITGNNRHRGWFASIGTYVNDERGGVEFQAGLPFLYAVIQPKWSSVLGFNSAFGIGNSTNLKGNFSLDAMYLYSAQKTSIISYPFQNPYGGNGPEVVRSVSVRQHQIKMAVRYSFSKTLSLRAGPVLNYLQTIREISVGPAYLPETVVQRRFESHNTRTLQSWMGWEASIQYRINFFESK